MSICLKRFHRNSYYLLACVHSQEINPGKRGSVGSDRMRLFERQLDGASWRKGCVPDIGLTAANDIGRCTRMRQRAIVAGCRCGVLWSSYQQQIFRSGGRDLSREREGGPRVLRASSVECRAGIRSQVHSCWSMQRLPYILCSYCRLRKPGWERPHPPCRALHLR